MKAAVSSAAIALALLSLGRTLAGFGQEDLGATFGLARQAVRASAAAQAQDMRSPCEKRAFAVMSWKVNANYPAWRFPESAQSYAKSLCEGAQSDAPAACLEIALPQVSAQWGLGASEPPNGYALGHAVRLCRGAKKSAAAPKCYALAAALMPRVWGDSLKSLFSDELSPVSDSAAELCSGASSTDLDRRLGCWARTYAELTKDWSPDKSRVFSYTLLRDDYTKEAAKKCAASDQGEQR